MYLVFDSLMPRVFAGMTLWFAVSIKTHSWLCVSYVYNEYVQHEALTMIFFFFEVSCKVCSSERICACFYLTRMLAVTSHNTYYKPKVCVMWMLSVWEIYSLLGDGPLGYLWEILLIMLIDVERFILIVCRRTLPWAEDPGLHKWRRKMRSMGAHVALSWLWKQHDQLLRASAALISSPWCTVHRLIAKINPLFFKLPYQSTLSQQQEGKQDSN